MGPAWTVVHLAASDNQFTVAGQICYPNGQTWHAIAMLTPKGGKVRRETDYFAAPFEAPELGASGGQEVGRRHAVA